MMNYFYFSIFLSSTLSQVTNLQVKVEQHIEMYWIFRDTCTPYEIVALLDCMGARSLLHARELREVARECVNHVPQSPLTPHPLS